VLHGEYHVEYHVELTIITLLSLHSGNLDGCKLCEFEQFTAGIHGKHRRSSATPPFIPYLRRINKRFHSFRQQDASEFFSSFLNFLSKEDLKSLKM
jgi:ubiquitin C-terminal hydrolase